MKFHTYIIDAIQTELPDTVIFTLIPKNKHSSFTYVPGQYSYIRDPKFLDPDEAHPFSFLSIPSMSPTIQFCIKKTGDWTGNILTRQINDELYISEALGKFTWEKSYNNVVFLLGGIGITPIISMLRYINELHLDPQITLFYGNRTPQTVAFQSELDTLSSTHKNTKIVHIFSHLPPTHTWQGYRGFITQDILHKEIDISTAPVFFVVGPPIFIDKMKSILSEDNVSKLNIHIEAL